MLSSQQFDAAHETNSAGRLLVRYAKTDARKQLSVDDFRVIDQTFEHFGHSGHFETFQIEALRAALTAKTKNFAFAELLLRKRHISDRFLWDERDIIQLAIRDLDEEWHFHHHDNNGALPRVVRLLIEQGARVDSLDERGNSAVYYCCIYGSSNTFQTLVEAEFDPSFAFANISVSEPYGPIHGFSSISAGERESSLLDITLKSWLAGQSRTYITFDDVWRQPLDRTWARIILHLLREWQRPQSFDQNDPAMLKFFYVACAQGNLDVVRMLIDRGVSLSGPASRSDDREQIVGSALQAAVCGGQKIIVQLLLDHGADTKAETLFGGAQLGVDVEPAKLCTAINAALQFTAFGDRQKEVLDTCLMLVEVGATISDCSDLLKRCIRSHDLDTSRRLLEKGIRVPVSAADLNGRFDKRDALEIVQLLQSFNVTLDYASLQSHAAEKGQVKLLWYLVNSDGPRIPRSSLWGIVSAAVQRKSSRDIDMLRYLVREYGLDVNEPYPGYNNKGARTMLWSAVAVKNMHAITFLLNEGAKVECAGLEESMLANFRKDLVGRSSLGLDQVATARVILSEQTPEMWRGAPADFVPLRGLLGLTHEAPSDSDGYDEAYRSQRRVVSYDEAYARPFAPRGSDDLAISHDAALKEAVQNFSYEPLAGLKPIRLLYLEPAESLLAPILCQVRHTELQDGDSYEVLSCTEDETRMSIRILLNGQGSHVSRSTWEALLRLRKPSTRRTFWVQDVCVNSADAAERSQQTTLLGDIYSTAQKVVCWLGEAGDGSGEVFKYLRDWKPAPNKNRGWGEPQDPTFSGSTAVAFRKLMRRPWFHRTTALWAVACATDIMLICGMDTLSWEGMDRAVRSWRPPQNGIWDSLSGLDERARWRNMADIRKCRSDARVCLHSIFKAVAVTEAEDPKEKIFAMVTIANIPEVPISYAISVPGLYQILTEQYIRKNEDLQMLHWGGTSAKTIAGLPSWMPDYSVTRPIGVLSRAFASSHYRDGFPHKVLSGFGFSGKMLFIKGKCVDAVKEIGIELVSDSNHAVGCSGFKDTLRDWESIAANTRSTDTPRRPSMHSLALLKDFLRTLSAGHPGGVGWYKRFGANILGEVDIDTIREYEDLVALEEWADIRKRYPTAHVTSQGHFTSYVESVAPGRRFLTTESGAMGLAHPAAQTGDSIVFFPGGLYPFILRRQQAGDYALIGDCYLSGLDEVDLFELDSQPAEEFRLS